MTEEALKHRIRRLTRWIRIAERRRYGALAEKFRDERDQLMHELSRRFRILTFFSDEGRMEFYSCAG